MAKFYLVIDNWDNGHEGDSEQSNSVVVADVTFVPVERSFVIPPMTVSLVFLSTFIAIMIVPLSSTEIHVEWFRAGTC